MRRSRGRTWLILGIVLLLAWRDGVAIVAMAKGGLMHEAPVGGQKFSFQPLGD